MSLAFCYALLSNDKIRQSDNYKKFQNSVSRKYQLFFSILIIHKEFLHGFPFLYISSIEGGE